MAIVKALRRLAAGGFGAIAATDQIQCDAGAMTVTEPGKASKAVPDALAGKADLVGAAFSGSVSAPGLTVARSANNGGLNLNQGGQNTGYMEFFPAGTGPRHGYMGFSDGVTITLAAEVGYFNFTGSNPRVGGQVIWHGGNFAPSQYARNDGATFSGPVACNGKFYPNGGLISYSTGASPDYTKAKVGGLYALTSPTIAKGAPVNCDYATFLNFTNRDTNSDTDAAQYALQLFADYFTDNDIYIRNTSFDFNSRPDKGWKKLFHTGNLTGQVILALIGAYAPTIGQFLRSLEASGAGRVSTVSAAIPADPGNTTNIAWNHATFVLQAGTLAQFVKTTLSLTDAQLATIISNAKTVVE